MGAAVGGLRGGASVSRELEVGQGVETFFLGFLKASIGFYTGLAGLSRVL